MRILCLGDVVGRPGRTLLANSLPTIRETQSIDFVIANVENITNGAGVREKECAPLFEVGVDAMTSGDHILDLQESRAYLEREPRLLRPFNYKMEGNASNVFDTPKGSVAVLNAIGHTFMREKAPTRTPFPEIRHEVQTLREKTPVVMVDFHAEVTSEKIAMGWHLDGIASAVFGTHTHVQTADNQVLHHGTGYVTDLGMCGPHDGVIGRDKELVLKRFIDNERKYLKVAREGAGLRGAIFSVDTDSGRCQSVKLFRHDAS